MIQFIGLFSTGANASSLYGLAPLNGVSYEQTTKKVFKDL